LQIVDHKKDNRTTLIAFLVVFTLPVMAAWVAYFTGWFEGMSTTNKGEWVKPVIEFEDFNPLYADGDVVLLEPGQTWKIILPASVADCNDEQAESLCLINLYMIGQTHVALGKEYQRIDRILFNETAAYDEQGIAALKQRFVDLRIVNGKSTTKQLSTSYIYIADPVGNIMLRYPLVKSKEDVFIKGKDILKDLKNLLKLSRLR
jgi:hypothetical protein